MSVAKAMSLHIPLTKVDEEKHEIHGVMAAEVPDKTGEVFDYASGKAAVLAWSQSAALATKAAGIGHSAGNLRVMHTKAVAGKLLDVIPDDAARQIHVVAKVTDAKIWSDVLDGVYTGFSLGGSYAKRWTDPVNKTLRRFTPAVSELSLADNPCCAATTFSMVKEKLKINCHMLKSRYCLLWKY